MPKAPHNLYAEIIQISARNEDGSQIASLIDLCGSNISALPKELISPSQRTLDIIEHRIPEPWNIVAVSHLETVSFIQHFLYKFDVEDDFPQAFKRQQNLLNAALRAATNTFDGLATGWVLPILYSSCRNLKLLAEHADKVLRIRQEKAHCLEETSRAVTRCFTICLQDRSLPLYETDTLGQDMSKRKGAYYFTNILFKIYFKLKNISLCKNIIRSVESAKNLRPVNEYPRSHQVTYRYYLGVLSFMDENYRTAEEHLNFAFENCHKKSRKNIELILNYLIPLRLQHGYLPSKELLTYSNQLKQLYEPFVDAFRKGDLAKFDQALIDHAGGKGTGTEDDQIKHPPGLLDKGTYLIMIRIREGCIRQLCKQVWLIMEKSTRISIETFQIALQHVGQDIDSDEVECILANLIFKGHLKGYISHEKRMVVLSKVDPFPSLNSHPIINNI